MKLLIDVGNTKAKWVLTDNESFIGDVGSILVDDVMKSNIVHAAQSATEILVSNVAGPRVEHVLRELFGEEKPIVFAQANAGGHAGGVLNAYQSPKSLGIDRWAALVAAYHTHQTHCIVVNAGTAITVDALTVTSTGATFLGGTISPGLRLMQIALRQNTAQLNPKNGDVQVFPVNTDDAIYNGCLNAALGAIQTQWQHLEGLVKMPPKLLLSGGDAAVLAKNLPEYLVKHHNIVDNLVLVGLMRLGREKA